MNLLSFKGYEILSESANTFSKELDSILNESIGAALGNPISFLRIKNNAKKYQQALVQVAINNLDFEKKKASGRLEPEMREILQAATDQKNQALRDKADALSDRMDQLATTDGLKTVAALSKNKAKIAAAETALTTADGEESKALKLRVQGLNKKVAADQQQLNDYAKRYKSRKKPKSQDAAQDAAQDISNIKTS